ncbi:hypothetical protein B0J11DRAFT_597580 [Dendryphion nanum]|uniref:Zn(2)-C6 fungal-type domain-containing protein n=1 Tax=Dendryphion nanum TaxID=256645 RepID=A0A9P9D562_9PLEO|nr:hypothetical protein B0J11DRAFT_597580 [Dendryphion nanum]
MASTTAAVDLVGQSRADPNKRTRRSKGKSRLGCVGCKARKVKCDELRPACSRCNAYPHRCTYLSNSVPKWNEQVITFALPSTLTAEAEVIKGESQTAVTRPQREHVEAPLAENDALTTLGNQISPGIAECNRVFDTQDVFLMMHFMSTTSIDLLGDPKLWAQDTMQLALQHDFLMHAILTLAARHLQETTQSENHPSYNYRVLEAHHLQKTLSNFSHAFNDHIHANQDAVLATSFLLFFHASSSVRDINVPSTQPCEDASFTFLRGIQSVVADGSHIAHSGRYKTLVAPPLPSPIILPRTEACTGPGILFIQLINNLPPRSPYVQNREIYIEQFESLTLHLSTSTARDLKAEALEELLFSFLRWQALCPPVFVDLVKAHDVIALVILAHYYAAVGFVLSQVKNKWWWFQRKPRHMVKIIGEYVGPAWAAWLEWPRAAVQRYERSL